MTTPKRQRPRAVGAAVPLPAPAKAPVGIPRIRWVVLDDTLQRADALVAPSIAVLQRNRGNNERLWSPELLAALTAAVERVWILDRYASGLDGVRFYRQAIPRANAASIRIVSKTVPEASVVKELEPLAAGVDLEWRAINKDGSPWVHDRFAIIDDELFHFGSTVGGGHPTLNAYSAGFDANVTGMARAFEQDVWGRWTQ